MINILSMKPLYIAVPDERTNPIIRPQINPWTWGTGVASTMMDRVTWEKPNVPYYYYIYAFNDVIQRTKLMMRAPTDLDDNLYVPKDVKKDILNGQCKIILDHSLEGFDYTWFGKDTSREFLGEWWNNVIYLTGDYGCSANKYFTTRYINYWERQVALKANALPDNIVEYHKQRMSMDTPARFKTICKNRLLRPHRPAVVKWIHDLGIQDSVNYSMGMVTAHGPVTDVNYDVDEFKGIMKQSARIYNQPWREYVAFIAKHGERNLYHETINLSENQASPVGDALLEAHCLYEKKFNYKSENFQKCLDDKDI